MFALRLSIIFCARILPCSAHVFCPCSAHVLCSCLWSHLLFRPWYLPFPPQLHCNVLLKLLSDLPHPLPNSPWPLSLSPNQPPQPRSATTLPLYLIQPAPFWPLLILYIMYLLSQLPATTPQSLSLPAIQSLFLVPAYARPAPKTISSASVPLSLLPLILSHIVRQSPGQH